MAALEITADPDEMGLDPSRLSRITSNFDEYVADGRLAGYLTTVARGGELVWTGKGGMRDREAGVPMSDDTIFRIYSMTKPITSVAAMVLFEQGRFELTDEIAPIIGCFEDPRIFSGGTSMAPLTIPSPEPIRIWHLLTHTAGLTYGFQYNHIVDQLYRNAGYDLGNPRDTDLAKACADWATLPLLFEPGTRWNYSVSVDVLGRVIEVVYGAPLDVALAELVLEPLGMDETGFFVPEDRAERLAQLYLLDGHGKSHAAGDMGKAALHDPQLLSGGGGLVSTAADYRRFTAMLQNGGELDGVRVLGPRTLEYMIRNHLPGGVDLASITEDIFSETAYEGVGFGLGFSVVLDGAPSKSMTSEGSFAWGGAASTAFWVDPAEALEVSFFTQALPSGLLPIRPQLSQLVYAAITE